MERREYEQRLAAAEKNAAEKNEAIHQVYELGLPAIERRRMLEAAHAAANAAGKEVEAIEKAWEAERLAERLEYAAALGRRLK